MPDPNLSLLEEAATKLAPFLDEIVFVGGVNLGLLITDKAAAPIRSTDDVDVIAEILTYVDYIAFSERPVCFAERPTDQGDHSSLLPGYQDGSIRRTWTDGLPGQPDLEEFIAVVYGRSTILREVADSPTMFASISLR